MSQKELETIAAVVAQRLKGMQERQDEQLAALKDRIRLLESTLLRSDVGPAAVDECQVPLVLVRGGHGRRGAPTLRSAWRPLDA